MVTAYIDDFVIATETVEHSMVRLREIFECLREAGFTMRVAKCDFMKSETMYLGRSVSAKAVKLDPKALEKLQIAWLGHSPQQSRDAISFWALPTTTAVWPAKMVAYLQAITGVNATFACGSERQQAFNEIKKSTDWGDCSSAAQLQGEFVLDTDASFVAISGTLHQRQGHPGERRLKPIVYDGKQPTATQAEYGAPKLKMYAAYHFIVKNHSYFCLRKCTLRVDN